jgi:hypothetical protein
MLCMLWSLSVQAQHTESSLIIYQNYHIPFGHGLF